MTQEWKIGDTGIVIADSQREVVILLDSKSSYIGGYADGMKIPFYNWQNGSEGYDQMIYAWGYDGTMVDRIEYVWRKVLNYVDDIAPI
jgi:hypothetical protein